ncbi:MAG: hypothetical protein IPF69_06645 [Chitinophagaceae bacterium]|nr:hypothetical protein [Chitinophagaceae bacterium]
MQLPTLSAITLALNYIITTLKQTGTLLFSMLKKTFNLAKQNNQKLAEAFALVSKGYSMVLRVNMEHLIKIYCWLSRLLKTQIIKKKRGGG